jgi:asparagine synthase (glutamine-hydrolysing)
LAGVFDPTARAGGFGLTASLAPHPATVVRRGPLRLAFTGPHSPPGDQLCLFDGFLDNAVELAGELGGPSPAGPEELLAAAYRRWGRGLPARLRGDFVLLVWDARQGEGLIARDQLGVRSLYLADSSSGLWFASEIHSLLGLLPTRPAPDAASVAHWIAVSNRPGCSTLYAGIRRLDPGSLLVLDEHGARQVSYWSPRFTEPSRVPPEQHAHDVRGALRRAVCRRIARDGQTGVLMSGGLDSASVAAVAAEQGPGRVSAYSGVFPEHPEVDESDLIVQMRQSLGLSGADIEVRPGGLLSSAIECARAWQVPLLGWSDFWTLPLLRAAARAGVTVTLGGDGGDELFGPRVHLLADRLRAGRPRQALALALELPGAGDRPPRRQVARVFADSAVVGALPYRLHSALWRGSPSRRPPRWLHAEAARDLLRSDDPFAWKRLDGPRWWAHSAHGLTRGVEETGIFEHQRRRAALAGLEARHPLFDLDLLELALRQPPELTLDRHRSRPVLRASMAGLLPDSVRMRPQKAWFDSLIADCLTGRDGAAVRQLLTDPRAELGAFLDPRAVDQALFGPAPGGRRERFEWMHQVWRLVTAECWLRAQSDPAAEWPSHGLGPTAPNVSIRASAPGASVESYVFPP